MVALAVVGVLVGAVLALRFKVFALVVAISSVSVVIAVAGGSNVWWTAGAIAVAAASVQLGYFGAAVLRFALNKQFHREHSAGSSRHMHS